MAPAQSPFRKLARSLLSRTKSVGMHIPVVRRAYSPFGGTHPFDREFGIETSGRLGTEEIHPDKRLNALISPYIGSQPSIVREAIGALRTYEDCTFIDYGCGKGRALVVASEFGFQSVMGVELSASLAATARSNAGKIAARFPDRPVIEVVTANVCDFSLPPGRIVCFNYHAFGQEILGQVIARCEAALAAETSHMFFVYYNPVHFELFDASPVFKRFFVAQIPYDETEVGFGPDADDAVVIWQSVRGATHAPYPGADRRIVRTGPMRAQVAD